jgi:glutaredoxin
LASKGVDFKLYDIEKDPEAARRKQQLDPGRAVPFAIINGIKVRGWSRQIYETALEE